MPPKKQPKKDVFIPIWPSNTPSGSQTSELPIIEVIADSNRGKSSFIASIYPRIGKDITRTLVFDTEGSWSTLRQQLNVEIIDIAERAQEFMAQGDSNHLAYFNAYFEMSSTIEAGQYDVIAIDSGSKLFPGTQMWLMTDEGQEQFKPQGKYRDKIGVMTSWADANRWWGIEAQRLARLCQTVVIASHRKQDFKKGGKKVDGINIYKDSSLSFILYDQRDRKAAQEANIEPQRFGWVQKDRLTMVSIDEQGELRTHSKLPRKLIQEHPTESFASIIRRHMRNPQIDWGDLDDVSGDLSRLEDDAIVAQRDADKAQAELEMALNKAKRTMISNLMKDGSYPDANAIAEAIRKNDLSERANQLPELIAVENELRQLVQIQQEEVETETSPAS